MSTTVCITPLTLGYPQGGGHLWVYLNWALSLSALGCRVLWLEEIGEFAATRPKEEVERDIALLGRRLDDHGLGSALALASTGGEQPLDPSLVEGRLDLDAVVDEADLLLDFAYDTPRDVLARFRSTALVDLDPGLLQLWASQGDLRVGEHDAYFTIGETVGTSRARFPDGGVPWLYTPPPVFLPAWEPVEARAGAPYTTVSNWWGEWLYLDGESVNNDKRTAFLEYLELPRRTSARLELALTMDDYTAVTDGPLLRRNGWTVEDAWETCASPERYQSYIRGSRGEFSCAKPSCRLLVNAWISDRTICYLASGKPAVVEHTGDSCVLPEGEGLFRFRDLDQAVAAIEEVEADYERHSGAARALAEERFDGEQVARKVLERALP